ncbi:MAG: hypothetical protein EHM36_01770 [Deltaproteobacteria bacterium]|nr:MAG: hypothetical protein EHM36_01770 [Deltaproteobacteria bacterium]
MNVQIEKTLSSLRSRCIKGIYAENSEEANQGILSLIPIRSTVGLGDSTTLNQMGTIQTLKEKGIRVLDPFEAKRSRADSEEAQQERRRIVREATICDVFLAGTNAITQDGKIVNVDGAGNRVAGMFWGHPLSIIVVGRNKIVKDLDEAFHRIRKTIAPNHFRIRAVEMEGRKRKTPCVATGECNDCRALERGCNIFTIIEHKPYHSDICVIIVNQDLGLGWDPSWPADRIDQIKENYKKFVWIPPPVP